RMGSCGQALNGYSQYSGPWDGQELERHGLRAVRRKGRSLGGGNWPGNSAWQTGLANGDSTNPLRPTSFPTTLGLSIVGLVTSRRSILSSSCLDSESVASR